MGAVITRWAAACRATSSVRHALRLWSASLKALPRVTGNKPVPNDHLADAQKHHPDVFIAFGVIDP